MSSGRSCAWRRPRLENIPDDPIIKSMIRTGYPTWWGYEMEAGDDDYGEGDEDVDIAEEELDKPAQGRN